MKGCLRLSGKVLASCGVQAFKQRKEQDEGAGPGRQRTGSDLPEG